MVRLTKKPKFVTIIIEAFTKIKKEGVYCENGKCHVGEKVTLKANGGRRKIVVNKGVLEKTYDSIFIIRLDSNCQRTVSYSYSDVLTKTVQLVFAG